MKFRERLKEMRKKENLVERLLLAADRYPLSRFDRLIHTASLYPFDTSDEQQRALHNEFEAFQNEVVASLKNRRSDFFRELADGIDASRKQRRNRSVDKIRLAILMYAAEYGNVVTVRGVVERLRHTGFTVTEETRRIVRRVCKELKIVVKGKAGRPAVKRGHDSKKALR